MTDDSGPYQDEADRSARIVLFLVSIVAGLVTDALFFQAFESAAGVGVPNFNLAINALVRIFIVFGLLLYFGTWRLAVGRETPFLRRVAPGLLIVLTLTIPSAALWVDVARNSTNVVLSPWLLAAAAVAVAAYTWTMRRIYPQLEDIRYGRDWDEGGELHRLFFLSYPPRRRSDMVIVDALALIAIACAASGAWLVFE